MNELADDTPIFRIYNIFDLINTLSTNSIRLSQVCRMEDPNELFGIYFRIARSMSPPFDAEHLDQSQREFRSAQSHHYMTCWTRVPQNIAVWSLYSPTRDAIQVRTTYGNLRRAMFAHFQAWPYAHAYKLQPNDQTDLFLPPAVGPVKYIDFEQAYSKIRRQLLEYNKEKEKWFLKNGGPEIEDIGEKWLQADGQIKASVFSEPLLSGPLLKDIRYQHEQEVRFVLQLQRRDGRTKDEYEAHPMAGLDHPARPPKIEDCPPNVFVPFAATELDDFQVDGRIESYKFEAISNALGRFGVDVKLNSAFHPFAI
ncbi:hypothetical protein [Paracoccus xiamenensis]|uniref:hypothetical protein n=1 Tax=Paracoccus xiamenensis TaxID=2714901 RepID=UPI001408E43F|nr:hypothetical protein [Paracoccus xiamenensis]NHF73987.1 hypothetical protein [Paracoccus xiamenensis]